MIWLHFTQSCSTTSPGLYLKLSYSTNVFLLMCLTVFSLHPTLQNENIRSVRGRTFSILFTTITLVSQEIANTSCGGLDYFWQIFSPCSSNFYGSNVLHWCTLDMRWNGSILSAPRPGFIVHLLSPRGLCIGASEAAAPHTTVQSSLGPRMRENRAP